MLFRYFLLFHKSIFNYEMIEFDIKKIDKEFISITNNNIEKYVDIPKIIYDENKKGIYTQFVKRYRNVIFEDGIVISNTKREAVEMLNEYTKNYMKNI